jgi:hypothetical protein
VMLSTTPRLRWVSSAVLVVLGTATLLALALSTPQHLDLAARAYVIFLGAVVVRLLVRAIHVATWAPGPLPFDLVLGARIARIRRGARDLELIEQMLGSSTTRAMEFHYQLRPRLRQIAADRLAANHGIALDEDPESARRLLGDEPWELLRPDREPPEDRFGPGAPLLELELIVTAVERL